MNHELLEEREFEDACEIEIDPTEANFFAGISLLDCYCRFREDRLAFTGDPETVRAVINMLDWKVAGHRPAGDYAGLWEPLEGDLLALYNEAPVGRVSRTETWTAYLDGYIALRDLGDYDSSAEAQFVVAKMVMDMIANGRDID